MRRMHDKVDLQTMAFVTYPAVDEDDQCTVEYTRDIKLTTVGSWQVVFPLTRTLLGAFFLNLAVN